MKANSLKEFCLHLISSTLVNSEFRKPFQNGSTSKEMLKQYTHTHIMGRYFDGKPETSIRLQISLNTIIQLEHTVSPSIMANLTS